MKLLRYIGFCIFAFAAAAHAQYGRYQNCQLQNAMGQAVAGAQVYILTQPANTAALTPQATIYSNATGAGGAIPQPVFTDGFGQCSIYAAPGLYTVVYNSPLTGILVYPDQIISTTGDAIFTPTGVPYVISPTANTVATIPQIQNQAGLGVHTNAYLEPNSSTFLYSPLSCATSFVGPTCIDATSALQAAQAAAALSGAIIHSDAAPPGYGVFYTQIQAFNGEGGIQCDGRHYEQGCVWYQIPGTNKDGIVPNPGLPAQGYLDYYLIDGMAFYGDFTYTSTTGSCINFGPLRVAERTEVNRTTCNSWPNNGFYVSGGSDPLYFTDTEASGNGYGAGGGYGWNFYNSGGNTFDMVTLQAWSADNNVSGAINIQNPSDYGCVTCGDTFIFRSGKMESRYDNLHYPDGQPVGINLNNTSGTPVIIDGLSAISVDPAGAPITTVVRNGSGTMVITTPTPHPPAHVGSLIAMNGNSQSVFNLPAVFTVTASTQTTTTVSMSGGALTGTGGNMFYKVVTDELVNITGNSANVKLNGVTMAGGQDAYLGPFGWYNIINDHVNGFENNITNVPNHSTASGGSWVSANYTYPNFCADFQCMAAGTQTFNEELFNGTTVSARIASAVTACGSVACTIQVPPNAPAGICNFPRQTGYSTGCWANTPNNVVVQDQRYYPNGSGIAQGFLTAQFSPNYIEYHAGANDPYESATDSGKNVLAISTLVDGGTNNNNNQANVLSFFANTIRDNPSARSVWGGNFNVSFNTDSGVTGAAATATGMEIDLNNFGSLDDPGTLSRGIQMGSGGGHTVGYGIIMSASPGSEWQTGIALNNYSSTGIVLASAVPTRSADIMVIPPVDNNHSELFGTNAAQSLNLWNINGLGQASFTGISVGPTITTSLPGITHTSTVPCTGTLVFTNGILTSTTGSC